MCIYEALRKPIWVLAQEVANAYNQPVSVVIDGLTYWFYPVRKR